MKNITPVLISLLLILVTSCSQNKNYKNELETIRNNQSVGDYTIYHATDDSNPKNDYQVKFTTESIGKSSYIYRGTIIKGQPPKSLSLKPTKIKFKSLLDKDAIKIGETKESKIRLLFYSIPIKNTRLPNEIIIIGKIEVDCEVILSRANIAPFGFMEIKTWCNKIIVPHGGRVKSQTKMLLKVPGEEEELKVNLTETLLEWCMKKDSNNSESN